MSEHKHECRPIPDTNECICACGAKARDQWVGSEQEWVVTYDPAVEAKKAADRALERRELAKELLLRTDEALSWRPDVLAEAAVAVVDALFAALDKEKP